MKYQAMLMYRLRFARGCALELSLLRFVFALPSKSLGELIVSALAFASLEIIMGLSRAFRYRGRRGGGRFVRTIAEKLRGTLPVQ
jgi:hypothetical protein